METNRILTGLRAERGRIDRAITALERLNSTGRRTATLVTRVAAGRKSRRPMSVAARRKLSRLLKQRWAQGKMKPKVKAKAA